MVSLYLFKDRPHLFINCTFVLPRNLVSVFSPHLIFFKFLLFLYLLNFFGGVSFLVQILSLTFIIFPRLRLDLKSMLYSVIQDVIESFG